MSSPHWDEIEARIEVEREAAILLRSADRVRRTAEVFTPSALVIELLQRMPLSAFAPGRTVFDPACGDGQFLSGAKWLKVLHFGMAAEAAISELYGVDIMADNVALCRARLGGGNIVVGDVLSPLRFVPGQTDEDRRGLWRILGMPSEKQPDLFGSDCAGAGEDVLSTASR